MTLTYLSVVSRGSPRSTRRYDAFVCRSTKRGTTCSLGRVGGPDGSGRPALGSRGADAEEAFENDRRRCGADVEQGRASSGFGWEPILRSRALRRLLVRCCPGRWVGKSQGLLSSFDVAVCWSLAMSTSWRIRSSRGGGTLGMQQAHPGNQLQPSRTRDFTRAVGHSPPSLARGQNHASNDCLKPTTRSEQAITLERQQDEQRHTSRSTGADPLC